VVRRLLPVLLLAPGITACGFGDVSAEEFCEAYTAVYGSTLEEDLSDEEALTGLRDWADELERVGPAEDMSDEARAGFEATVSAIQALPADASAEDVAALDQGLEGEAAEERQAYAEYVTQVCLD
jgi:hypothetical protein